MVSVLDPASRDLLRSFRLTDRQRLTVWEAFLESQAGLIDCAHRARARGRRNGNTGAGLLLTMVAAGEHHLQPEPQRRPTTGWRFVRGTHSGNYVRDPQGTDKLPEGYGVAV